MQFDLAGKTAFVTGATSGLGRRFATVLAQAGAQVAICGRRADRLQTLQDELQNAGYRCASIVLDVTKADALAPALDETEAKLGPVDILVNNAGMNIQGLVVEQSVEEFDTVLNTNLRAPFLLAREVGKRMIAREKGGRIINVGSIGSFRVLPGLAAYCISKAGIAMMTQCLAREWVRYNINVNAICPGYIETELNSFWFRSAKGEAQIRTFPKRKLQQEEDLDGLLLLLASDASRAMTGSVVSIDEAQSL